MTIASPDNIRTVASGLDHPECVSFGPDGMLYAGGEAGQLYRIDPQTGAVHQWATADAFLMLGVTLDGDGNVYGCSVGRQAVVRVSPQGSITTYSTGARGHALVNPNYSVFDSVGNLYFSDSGDYYSRSGALYVVRPGGVTEPFCSGPLAFPNGLAIDPDERHLYVVQSTGPDIVRFPLNRPGAAPERVVALPGAVPDGIAFDERGRLAIACYRPDRILLWEPDGSVAVLMDDPGGDLLNQPTNVALAAGRVYFANLGGWHIGAFDADLTPMPLRFPRVHQ